MTEHAPCPRCRHGNPPKNRFCGWCGAPLTSSELVPRRGRDLAVAGRTLPVRLKPVGKALAVGVAALAAEAGLSWLRRRAEGEGRPSMPAARDVDPALLVGQSLEEVLVRAWVGDSQSRIFAASDPLVRLRGTDLLAKVERTFPAPELSADHEANSR